jgi:hypothetical protein
MTNQEVFDKVVVHLRSMASQSVRLDGVCAYRGIDGLKCAIGIFIPDDVYSPDMEGPDNGVERLLNNFNLPELKEIPIDLLKRLQSAHDSGDNWGEDGFFGEYDLETTARIWSLSYLSPEYKE